MRFPTDLLYLAFIVIAVVGYVRRRGPLTIALVAMGVIGIIVGNLQAPGTLRVGLGPIDAVLLVAIVASGLYVFDSRSTSFGRTDPEWEFDRDLHRHRKDLDQQLLAYRGTTDWAVYGRWKRETLEVGDRVLGSIRRLQAPTPEWARVRNRYVALYREILDRIARDDPPDDASTLMTGTELRDEADELRRRHRASRNR